MGRIRRVSGALILDSALCDRTGPARPGRVTILTSDTDDFGALTAAHPRIVIREV